MNIVLPVLLIFTALTPSVGSAVTGADPLRFGQSYCPYTVEFPAAPTQTETPSQDGSKFVAAELLLQGMRLSAFCAADTPGVSQNATPPAAPSAGDRDARITNLIIALGITNYLIAPIGPLAPDCSEVEGTLASNGTDFRIVSALCFGTNSTFVAEAVFGSGADEKIAQNFLQTMRQQTKAAVTAPVQ